MLWPGAILLVVSALLLLGSRRATRQAVLSRGTATSSVVELERLVREVAVELPGEEATGYAQFVEIKGQLRCDDPIHGELSHEAAAIVETRVERLYETRVETRDAQGHVRTEWQKGRETLSQNRHESPFHLADATGAVRVLPTGARVDLVTVVDRFEPASAVEQGAGGTMTIGVGAFRVSIGSLASNDRRTLGYQFQEAILPLDRDVYALGEFADTSDGTVLRRPSEGQKPFLLSLQSEAEVVRKTERSARLYRYGAIAGAILGIVLVVKDLIR
jgi:hypothetical protein